MSEKYFIPQNLRFGLFFFSGTAFFLRRMKTLASSRADPDTSPRRHAPPQTARILGRNTPASTVTCWCEGTAGPISVYRQNTVLPRNGYFDSLISTRRTAFVRAADRYHSRARRLSLARKCMSDLDSRSRRRMRNLGKRRGIVCNAVSLRCRKMSLPAIERSGRRSAA